MTRWTEDQLTEYMAKRDKLSPLSDYQDFSPADEGPESVLQGKIERWAETWGRPCLSFRQNPHVKRIIPAGYPDITLILPGARVLFLELKAGKGRLSPEQKLMKLQFMALKHEIHEIRSYRAFLKLVNGPNQA